MNKNISIQLKAALLLIVFSMNIVIGFACAVGVDMGFNSKHHHDDDDEATEGIVHVHAEGKKYVHEHEEKKGHHHAQEGSEKDGCCNDSVVKFQSLDKILGSNANASINLPVFIAIIPSFYKVNVFKYPNADAQKYRLLFFHPPPPDIRILIQSFQI